MRKTGSGLESRTDQRMNQTVRDSRPDPVFLSQHINASMRAMNGLRMILHRGNLDRLDKAMLAFREAFEPVQQYITDKKGDSLLSSRRSRNGKSETVPFLSLTEEEMSRLRQLEMMHHKVMRSITEKMYNVQEDIRVIEDARSRLYHVAEMVGVS